MSFFQNGNLIENLTNTATAAGTTTLTVASKSIQIFTGTTTQTVKLPVATTLVTGQKYEIINTSTGALTIQYQDASAFATPTVAAGDTLFIRLSTNGTANGVWVVEKPPSAGGGGSSTTQGYELSNLGISSSLSGNDLVVSLKQANGTTDPAASAGAVLIGMRSTTGTTGGYNQRSVTSALSFTLNAKASLSCFGDTVTVIRHDLWVYAIDSDGAGTIKLGISPFKFPDLSLQSTIQASQTFTVTVATPAVFTATNHGFYNGMKVNLTTTGALPTGLAASTYYFVKSVAANTFQLSAVPNGTSINTTGTQSGTHTVHAMGICIGSDGTYVDKPVRLIGYIRSQRNTTNGFTGWLTPSVVSTNTFISEGMVPQLSCPADIAGDGFASGSDQTISVAALGLTSPYDPQGMLAGGDANHFTCQVTGMYQFYVKMMLEPGLATWNPGELARIVFYVNAVQIGYVAQYYAQTTHTSGVILNGLINVRMNRGDVWNIMMFQNSGGTQQSANNDYENTYAFMYTGPAN